MKSAEEWAMEAQKYTASNGDAMCLYAGAALIARVQSDVIRAAAAECEKRMALAVNTSHDHMYHGAASGCRDAILALLPKADGA